jgi:ribosomal protein S18 acetylase RimI-like enzyme
MLRMARLNDIDDIKRVAAKHTRELGFILRPALQEAVRREELIYDEETGAFCHYHTRRDGVSVIYEICTPVEARGKGIAKKMISWLPLPIRLKCPVDNESNKFYKHIGFTLAGTEPGKSRALNVWTLDKWPVTENQAEKDKTE